MRNTMGHFRKVLSTNHVRKGFWATMALAHTPALVNAWNECVAGGASFERVGEWVVLALSMIFFVLKVRGVRWLQFRADRRACLAFTLAVGLIHLDCIQPGIAQKIPIDCTMVFTTTVLVVGLQRASRALHEVLRYGSTHKTIRSVIPASTNTVWYDTFHPHCWVYAYRNVISRAPPA